jgi:hypothetical protein
VPPVFTGTNTAPFATLLYTDTLSGLAVVQYDASAAQWKLIAQTDTHAAPGVAAPLPAAAQGRNLLHTEPPLPVLQLRTALTPTVGSSVPVIALHLFGWQDGKATPLHMRPAGATSDVDAVFTGAVDAQLLDMDNDGGAEVIVDDAGKTTIWKWDGARFAPR